jgi:hypothetical protein
MAQMIFLLAFVLLAVPQASPADSQWTLIESTLTYHVTHPFHSPEGVSHAATGKGTCHNGQCDFEISAPVKSFDSGNSYRDHHMLRVARGEEFPTIVVHVHIAEAAIASSTILADLNIQFAGANAEYTQVSFQHTTQGADSVITGTIPATCSDFKIQPPSVVGIAIKNEIPIRVEMKWHAQ